MTGKKVMMSVLQRAKRGVAKEAKNIFCRLVEFPKSTRSVCLRLLCGSSLKRPPAAPLLEEVKHLRPSGMGGTRSG